ncbi:MAG: OmpA family protein [Cyclobacteriaceae bacterium]|nr:OmpA family protein [Cyclobacteriaceae bacterium]MDH4295023.1 OmpA family protein [Cyclobacteriaceae bacterium]MDH5248490.1 OmpA family protein [Cyclobacteriaceae bacterium]
MTSIRSVLIFLTFISAFFNPCYSQQDPKETARQYMEQAELIMAETKAMDDAREIMVTAADLDTTYIQANYEAGRMHLVTVGKDRAVKYLLRVYRQDPDFRFDIEYWIGRSYQFGESFDEALVFYRKYKDKLTKKSNYQGKDKVDMATVDRGIFECENGKEFISKPGNFSIVNIGREINSEFEDYAPVLNENENEIVFTSRRREDNLNQNVYDDNKPYEDIFTSKKVGNAWTYAKNIGPVVNNPYHDSNLALSADGNTLFLFKDDGGGDIFFTKRQPGGEFGPPVPLPGSINSSYEEKSVTISQDEKTLYFSSNRPGGFGGLDIYRATKDSKGEWSNVKNLGPKINTDNDDDGPFIDYDGVTLYFSSKGRKGMGGFDVFKATLDLKSSTWSEPVNLGYPINTPDDDIYIVFSKDGKRAYYSSVREDGMGYTDIYLITIPEGIKNIDNVAKLPVDEPTNPTETDSVGKKDTKTLKPLRYIITVVDAANKASLDAKVRMQGSSDNIIVPVQVQGKGVFAFTVTSDKPKDYRLSVEVSGYVFFNQNIKIEGASATEKTINRTIEMRKLSVGVSSILRNIYFDFDKASFQTESYSELNKLEAMLVQNSRMVVEIAGHTDAIGSNDYNQQLSLKRAQAVKDYLTKKGIDPRRIQPVGYGKTRPLASNDDEEGGRELNRRVEFKVLQNQ